MTDYKNLVITKPDKSDYVEIVQVWEASVRASHHFLTEENIQYFKPLILAHYLDAVELCCIRDVNAGILGFAGTADGKLEMLFIHTDHFRRSLGKKLMLHVMDQNHVTAVDVNEENPDAVQFYLGMGFEIYERTELDGLGFPFPVLKMKLKEK